MIRQVFSSLLDDEVVEQIASGRTDENKILFALLQGINASTP